MTNFPMLFLMTVISTNWISNGDFKRESGSNYIGQRLVVQTNIFTVEVNLCTNRTLYSSTQGTNGPTRWTPAQGLTPPPLPTMTKE